MKLVSLAALALAMGAAPAAAQGCTYSHTQSAQSEAVRYVGHHEEAADIVATADAAGSFKTLLAAAAAADLVDALKGDGPLTVFAPNDAAFEALPEGTVETLLKPENKDQLAAVLKLHVIAGQAVSAEQLTGAVTEVETLGGPITIDGRDGVRVENVNVIAADVNASNGIIHVIESVILPATSLEGQ